MRVHVATGYAKVVEIQGGDVVCQGLEDWVLTNEVEKHGRHFAV